MDFIHQFADAKRTQVWIFHKTDEAVKQNPLTLFN